MSKKRDFTVTRSGGYQYTILETPQSPEFITECSDVSGNIGSIQSLNNKETLLNLQDQLYQEYWNLIETGLTLRQKEVIKLCAQGKTQTEIAKILGVNQSSITKSINGNVDYANGKKVYGGAKKKMKRLANQNETIQRLLKAISELSD